MAGSIEAVRPSTTTFTLRWCGWRFAVVTCAVFVIAGATAAQAGINVWTSRGLQDRTIKALAIAPTTPTTVYAGGYENQGGGVFRSIDGGGTWSWSTHNTGLGWGTVDALAIDPTTSTTLYAAVEDFCKTGDCPGVPLYKSTDGGNTWSNRLGGVVSALAIDPTTTTTLYVGGPGGVYKSTDGADSWQAVNTDLTVTALAIDPKSPMTLHAGGGGYSGGGGRVFKSTDGGGTWSVTGLTNTYGFELDIDGLVIDPTTPTTLYARAHGGVVKSTDGGDTWSATGLPRTEDLRALAIDPLNPATLYAGMYGGGVLKTTNGGGTWNALKTGLTNLNVNALAIDPIEPRRLYAGTDGGVFAIEQAQVVGDGTPASCTETALDAALAPGGLVTFDCGAAPVTITITSTKTIANHITIDGGGRITLDGGGAVRIFMVDESAVLEVWNLTIADGHSVDYGGGIYNAGTLTLTNCTLRGNAAANGGGIFNEAALTVSNSTFSGNGIEEFGTGSGIYTSFGFPVTVTNYTFAGNLGTSILYNESGYRSLSEKHEYEPISFAIDGVIRRAG